MTDDSQILVNAQRTLDCFELSLEDYSKIKRAFEEAMRVGLCRESGKKSSLKMIDSYVNCLPSGSGKLVFVFLLFLESGHFLALDLGGTNYRILLVNLQPDEPIRMEEKTYTIQESIMKGEAKELFGYIARTLKEFLKSYDTQDEELKLGFTFSFPCVQLAVNVAKLVKWTKGFNVSGVEGEDVCALLQQSINEEKCRVRCVAVINDTVGTLASCALEDSNSSVGLIVGTGVNAAYIDSSSQEMPFRVINTECGAFGDCGELEDIRTKFDRLIDKESLRPGNQTFEKMVSGLYLGEIVRRVLVDLTEKGILFNGTLPEELGKPDSFSTRYMTEIERDPPDMFYGARAVLETYFNIHEPRSVDAHIVRLVCEKVSRRAAYLVGTVIAAIVKHMNRTRVTLGVDGSLFRYHTRFCENMIRQFDVYNTRKLLLRIIQSRDGSGKGAAAIAASIKTSASTNGVH